jgi:hypothetical protein
MSDKLKTDAILTALKERHSKEIWCEELAMSSGARRCDFWVLHPHASKGYRATAYEIKVSRADFKRDTRAKQRDARLFSDEFYYVTPPGLIKLEEVPDWAGLLEISEGRWKYISPAPRRDKDAPSWELVVSIMRNSGEVRRDTDLLNQQIRYLKAENEKWRKRDEERTLAILRKAAS